MKEMFYPNTSRKLAILFLFMFAFGFVSAQVDPVNYGASPNSDAVDQDYDDSAAIQAALSLGNDVVFGTPGIYHVGTRLLFAQDGQSMSASVAGVVLEAIDGLEIYDAQGDPLEKKEMISMSGNHQSLSQIALDAGDDPTRLGQGFASYAVKVGRIEPRSDGIGNGVEACSFYGSAGHYILACGFDVSVDACIGLKSIERKRI